MKGICIVCGNEFEIKDEICTIGRGSGKTLLALFEQGKRYCCSAKCLDKYNVLVKNIMYGVNE